MYTSILCEKDIIMEYYPGLNREAAKMIKEVIKIWLELKTRTASFERTEQLLAKEKVDVVAVMREVLSPRNEVFQKNEWLCF
jgi:2,4-dienoyl-CoA reductase-like NADH-dependent reductase (Old Yellow Enzyme family)